MTKNKKCPRVIYLQGLTRVHLPFLSTREKRFIRKVTEKIAKNFEGGIILCVNTREYTKKSCYIKSLTPIEPKVYIVGAGPGDPDLLTVKAQKLLAVADVILFADSLVPEQILDLCRPDAEIIRTANKTLEEIVPLMTERVRSHKSVVRLHSGDPSLYSATQEQMQLLKEAHIPFEVIPGISAFQAAAAKLQVELTVPGLVQTIILTRISGRTEVPANEELTTLAAHQASLCLYLSARHVEAAQAKLLQHYPASTPVAICFRIGWPDEKIHVVPLNQMADCTHQEQMIRTTLYVISPALLPATARSRLYHPEHNHLFRSSHQ